MHGSSEAPDGPHSDLRGRCPGNYVARRPRRAATGSASSGAATPTTGTPGSPQLAAPSGGLAALFADEATREAVRGALAARRCYATNGPRILLEAALAGPPDGLARPAGRRDPTRSRDGDRAARAGRARARRGRRPPLRRFEPGAGPRELALDAPVAGLRPGEALYLRAVQADDGAAWSSPWFVDAAAP